MNERVRMYVHPTARAEHIQMATDIDIALGNTAALHVIGGFPIEPIPDHVRIAMVVGGDGTTRSVADAMMKRDDPGVVIVTNAGSQNALHSGLVAEDVVVHPTEIADADQKLVRNFHPGQINEHYFTYIAETGRGAVPWSVRNESYRDSRIPRDARMYVAAALAGLKEARKESDEPIIQVYLLGGEFKSRNIFPGQNLFSDEITRVTVPALPKGRFAGVAANVLTRFALGRQFPDGLLIIERDTQFQTPDTGLTQIALGGDIFPIQNSSLEVRRADKAIRPAALVVPPGRRRRG